MAKGNQIKMRINKQEDCVCKVCGATRNNSLELFDIAFTDKHIITICDVCNEQLFSKTLKATCGINGKLKSQHDMKIIACRQNRYWSRKKEKNQKK